MKKILLISLVLLGLTGWMLNAALEPLVFNLPAGIFDPSEKDTLKVSDVVIPMAPANNKRPPNIIVILGAGV